MRYWPDGDKTVPGLLYAVRGWSPNNNGAMARTPALQDTTYAALTTGRVLGSGIVKNLAGTAKLYAGSTTKVYQASGTGTWTDRSGAVTFAAVAWEFCAFGSNVIASNGNSKLQLATTGNFADISQSAAGTLIVFPHANALIGLNTTADSASWARCVTGDHTTWTPAANNDADSGSLYGGIGGGIVAGGPWENLALAWKARAMYAGIYVGNSDPDQSVIRWSIVSNDVGCVSQFAWIATEVGVVFVSERGVMLFNGSKPYNIDDDIRQTFMAEAMTNRSRIFCTLDEGNNLVYIWISRSGAAWSSAAYTWNYKTQKWGYVYEVADNTGLTIGDPKTPVRNANYRDIVAIGGFATNGTETANLFFDHSNDHLLNLAGSSYTGTGPPTDGYIRTGIVGKHDRDSTLLRVNVISDAFSALSNLLLTVVKYEVNKSNSSSLTGVALTNGAYFDVQMTGRYFELQITHNGTSSSNGIQKIICDFQEAGGPKTFSIEL